MIHKIHTIFVSRNPIQFNPLSPILFFCAAFRCNPRETEYALRVVTRTKVAVVGASGYTGEELVRLLLAHPQVDLVAATSRQLAGKSLAEIFPRFAHDKAATLKFSDPDPKQIARDANVVFLALP